MTQWAHLWRFGFGFLVKHIHLISIDLHESCSINLVNSEGPYVWR